MCTLLLAILRIYGCVGVCGGGVCVDIGVDGVVGGVRVIAWCELRC